MGSKGSNQVTTNQSQTYTPNPQIGAAGSQAITGAQAAAQLPFQMPQAPVAPFSNFQNQAFNSIENLQGFAQPYFNVGSNYLAGSAAPVTGSDVAQFYNPMASNVTAQMQNIFGQQNAQNTGNLVQSAGGVGADRVAVGQANMANQQGLAAGQTYAGLYQQALQAAEQNKQMQAGAGYGFGQFGPAAQAAQMNSVNQLLGAGGMQQQLAQQQANAAYQQQLAQIALPYQQPQYLAGITAGLAPAMGGTTQGQSTTTYPAPSPFAQALGVGTSLLGMGGGMKGSIAGGSGMGGTLGAYGQYMPGGSAFGATPSYQNGGFYPMFDEGGAVHATPVGDVVRLDPFSGSNESLEDAFNRLDNRKTLGASGLNAANPLHVERAKDSGVLKIFPGSGRDDGGAVNDSTYGKLSDKIPLQEYGALGSAAARGNPLAGEIKEDLEGTYSYDDGGPVDQPMTGATGDLPFPGASRPKIGGGTPIPAMQLPTGQGGKSGPFGQYMYMHDQPMKNPSTGAPSSGSPSTGQEISMGINAASQLLPMLAMANRGGRMADGGPTQQQKRDAISHELLRQQYLKQHLDPSGGTYDDTPTAGAHMRDVMDLKPDVNSLRTHQDQIQHEQTLPFGVAPQINDTEANVAHVQPYRQVGIASGGTVGPMSAGQGFGADDFDLTNTWNPNDANTGFDPNTGARVTPTGGDPSALAPLMSTKDQDRVPSSDHGFGPAPAGAAVPMQPPQRATTPDTLASVGPPVGPRSYPVHPLDPNDPNYDPKLDPHNPQYDPNDKRLVFADPGGHGDPRAPGVGGGRTFPPQTGGSGPTGPPPMSATPTTMPQDRQPYPDALKRDWGQNMTRSPWMALVKAGAAMASTTGPIGTVIGRGIGAGAAELEGQRKSLESEEGQNLKAQQLYDEAQRHLDTYNKMTPYQQETLRIREQNSSDRLSRLSGVPGNVIEAIRKQVESDPAYIAAKDNPEIRARMEAEIEQKVMTTADQMRRSRQQQQAPRPGNAPAPVNPNAPTSEIPKSIPRGQGVTRNSETGVYSHPDGRKWDSAGEPIS